MFLSRRRAFGLVTALTFLFGGIGSAPSAHGSAQSSSGTAQRASPSAQSQLQTLGYAQSTPAPAPAPEAQKQEPAKPSEVAPAQPAAGKGRGAKGDRPAHDRTKGAPATVPAAVQPGATAPAMPDPAVLRSIAKEMVTLERIHRDRQARMDRLVEVFSQAKQMDKVKEIEALRAKETTRYSAAMQGFKKIVGPEVHGRILALMNGSTAGSNAPPGRGGARR
jgi:hypothetical protein